MNRTATIEKLVSTTGAYMVVDIAPVLCVTPTIGLLKRCTKNWLTLAALGLVNFASASQAQVQKTVLVINQFGQSAPVSVLISNQLRAAVHSDGRFQVQFYWENLDAADLSDDSLNVQRALIAQRYLGQHLDLIVLVGPDVAHFLTDKSKPFYPGVPVVFCCSSPGQPGQPVADYRSTGSWLQFDPAKTVDAALRLLPATSHVFVVAGQSRFDKGVVALAKASLASYEGKVDITYLTDLSMNQLQKRLKQLPDHSIVLFLTYFKDAQGREFLNSAEALPMIEAASNAPVFGVVDLYVGRGVVGGFAVNVEEQGRIAGRDVVEILGGKAPQDIPVVHGHSIYIFDWRALKHWNLDERRLPAGSTLVYLEPTIWDRYKPHLLTGLLVIVSLSLLVAFLLYRRRQHERMQAAEQFGGMLINAQEDERRRIASDLHDDFSQRLAMLSLGLDSAAQMIPESSTEANRHIQELSDNAAELGADLHTLSRRLHSSSLDKLGVTAAVSALCKEFAAQLGIKIECGLDSIPRSIDPSVALCIFRLTQEALRNVRKHSGGSQVQVNLHLEDSTIHLSVCDQGIGFNRKELRPNAGLGLRIMEERVRQVGGQIDIQSELGMGTKIVARLPMQAQDGQEWARAHHINEG